MPNIMQIDSGIMKMWV